MKSWSRTQEVLVRNDKYWGHQPLLDHVTLIPLMEERTELGRACLHAQRRNAHVLRMRLTRLGASQREDGDQCGDEQDAHERRDSRGEEADSLDERQAPHRRRPASS